MKLLLYAYPNCPRASKLEMMIRAELNHISIIHPANTKALRHHLKQPMNRISIVLAFVSSRKILETLMTMSDLFEDKKLILILPATEKLLLSKSLELTPSYISYQEQDLRDVLLVINHISMKQAAGQHPHPS